MRRAISFVAIAILTVASLIGSVFLYCHVHQRAWFTNAVNVVNENIGRAKELVVEPGDWMNQEIVHFADGTFMLFQQKCRKEDWRLKDSFVGHGSDGNWYQSDYHFCVDACVLEMWGQPKSLESFVAEYNLSPLDPN